MWKIRKKRANLQEQLDAILLREFDAPFECIAPNAPASALIIASPHSGRVYSQNFLSQTTLPLGALRLVEDAYVDKIVRPQSTNNIAFIRALFPRSYVDVNRSSDETPPYSKLAAGHYPRAISPRARIGLGVIPTRINIEEDIYPQDLTDVLISRRLEALYHPYHAALLGLIETARLRFGKALLLDCHSMPGQDPDGEKRPDFILGDRYGQSCHEDTIALLEANLRALGYSTARNHPYAGGYITRHYGKPLGGVQAIQIEINKDLYLNPITIEPHAGMKPLKINMEKIMLEMANYMQPNMDIAAQ